MWIEPIQNIKSFVSVWKENKIVTQGMQKKFCFTFQNL